MHVPDELVEAVRRGDPGAFEDLVQSTHAVVYTLAYRVTGNAEDAKDVSQEVYVRAWRGLRNFRGDANLGTWLHRITVNTALTSVRRRARRPIPMAAETMPELTERDPQENEIRILESALRGLPDLDRAVIVLKDVEGWTCEEIAQKMGSTEGAVKVRLFRARQRLSQRLAAEGIVVPMRRRKS